MTTGVGADDGRFLAVLRWARDVAASPLVVVCLDAELAAAGGGAVVQADVCVNNLPHYRYLDLALASGHPVVIALDACPDGASQASYLDGAAALSEGRIVVRREAVAPASPRLLASVARPPVSRRFLVRARTEADVGVHPADSDDQLRLVESLRALGIGAAGEAPGLVLAVDGCVACGVCVRACPHDALSLVTEGGSSVLWQQPERCCGERQCVEHCPEDAITVSGHHTWDAALAGGPARLASLRTRRCTRCRATIPAGPGDAVCGPCARRLADPFGWEIPAGLRDRMPERWRRSATSTDGG